MTKKVECKRSRYHGHHPDNEQCPMCEPQDEVTRELPAYDATAWAWVDNLLSYHGTTKGRQP